MYFLCRCLNCGIIDSSYNLKPWSHRICPKVNYIINKQKISDCYQHILLTPIPANPKTKEQVDRFVYCIDFINQYPDSNALSTRDAIDSVNNMMREP